MAAAQHEERRERCLRFMVATSDVVEKSQAETSLRVVSQATGDGATGDVVSFREIFGEQVSFLQAEKRRDTEKVHVLYVRTRETKEEVSE